MSLKPPARRPRPVVVSRQVDAPAEAVRRFLTDLGNHPRLAPGSVRLLSLNRGPGLGAHALVRLQGPLAMRRTASTELLETRAPDAIVGRATIGDATAATIVWRIEGNSAGSAVTLCATVDAASRLDGMLLRLGGRRWLARRFAAALLHLSYELNPAPVRHRSEEPRELIPGPSPAR
jgi:carbon monoxide dehydrogenase subunit G